MNNTDGFKITVINKQTADGMNDTVTETGVGTYRKKDDTIYITYSADNTRVFIKAENDVITVKRTGDAKSDIRYELGKRTGFLYRTPFGTIDMSICTESIISRANSDGGKISLSYILETGGDKLYNNMVIKIERSSE